MRNTHHISQSRKRECRGLVVNQYLLVEAKHHADTHRERKTEVNPEHGRSGKTTENTSYESSVFKSRLPATSSFGPRPLP